MARPLGGIGLTSGRAATRGCDAFRRQRPRALAHCHALRAEALDGALPSRRCIRMTCTACQRPPFAAGAWRAFSAAAMALADKLLSSARMGCSASSRVAAAAAFLAPSAGFAGWNGVISCQSAFDLSALELRLGLWLGLADRRRSQQKLPLDASDQLEELAEISCQRWAAQRLEAEAAAANELPNLDGASLSTWRAPLRALYCGISSRLVRGSGPGGSRPLRGRLDTVRSGREASFRSGRAVAFGRRPFRPPGNGWLT